MNKILAKSKNGISLKDHTIGLLQQLKNLINKVPELKQYEKLLELAAFAHDIGKIAPSFQTSLRNWDYKPRPTFPDIPHSLFSLLWIDEGILRDKIPDEVERKILLSAIAFHHWRDDFQEIILGQSKSFKEAIKSLLEHTDLRDKLLQNLKTELDDEQLNDLQDILNFNEDLTCTIHNGGDLLAYLFPPYFGYFMPYRISINNEDKKKLINISGNLMRIDHFTSYIQDERINAHIEQDIPDYETLKERIKQKLSAKTDQIWQLQEIEKTRDTNVVLIAPTGSGKTEFAYLWGAGKKLFFTLPIRSAVNSIFNRACECFGNENTGLLHSDADVYLFTRAQSNEKEKSKTYEGESLRILDMARQLSLPVLVSTGDQVFPSVLKYPGYEKIYSTLGYSRLVIDEVQAYDQRAVAIIIKLIEDIVNLGGKFLLMTATLPSFVKQELEKRIGKDNFKEINKYEDYKDIVKHKIELLENDIENNIDDILEKAEKGHRVLVILNTVEKAQEIYKKLTEKNDHQIDIDLLHSRFTFNNRESLENKIVGTNQQKGSFCNPKPANESEGKILVATQVVEASLDIDADILYTELAPLDSLIQRMGRVLRRVRDIESYNKYLHGEEPSEANIMIFYREPKDEIKLTGGAGTVYNEDLLSLSLVLLFKKAKPELINTKIREWQSSQKPVADFLKDLFETIKGEKKFIFTINEVEKKELVETELDNLLPQDSDYLQKFYETLDILDAGYMSEKKTEALKIFREIYTIPAIPESRREEFKNRLKEYLQRDTLSYTSFKIEVLSEFIVNVDVRKYLKQDRLSLLSASHLIYEINFEDKIKIKRVKEWLKDIYLCEGEYNVKHGFKPASNRDNFFL